MAQTQNEYTRLSNELDDVVAKLQSGDISVDEAVAAYETGMKLVAELEKYLKDAELKIQKITS